MCARSRYRALRLQTRASQFPSPENMLTWRPIKQSYAYPIHRPPPVLWSVNCCLGSENHCKFAQYWDPNCGASKIPTLSRYISSALAGSLGSSRLSVSHLDSFSISIIAEAPISATASRPRKPLRQLKCDFLSS